MRINNGIMSQPASKPMIGKTKTTPPVVPLTNANAAIQLLMVIWDSFGMNVIKRISKGQLPCEKYMWSGKL
jgi:hypothetical protein